MQGFYGLYYTGADGDGAAFGVLLYEGRVYGVDPMGGEVTGTYVARADGALDLAIVFTWPAGGTLVTGQTLTQPMTISSNITLLAATMAGAFQVVDLPVGAVNIRVEKKVAIS